MGCFPLYGGDLDRLRRIVMAAIILSSVIWFSATVAYMPYVLILAPKMPVNPMNLDGEMIPVDPYLEVQISAVLILCALFVDFLLLAGIYEPYTVDRDMFYPWLFYYAFFLPLAVVVAGLKGVNSDHRVKAAIPGGLVFIYGLIYAHVVALFIHGGKRTANVLKVIQEKALEPLTSAVQQA